MSKKIFPEPVIKEFDSLSKIPVGNSFTLGCCVFRVEAHIETLRFVVVADNEKRMWNFPGELVVCLVPL